MNQAIEKATQELIPDLKIGVPVSFASGYKQEIGVIAGYSKTGTVRIEYVNQWSGAPYFKYVLRNHTRRVVAVDPTKLPKETQDKLQVLIAKYKGL